MKVRERIPLAPMTTLGIGGLAQFFVDADGEHEVVEAFAWARSRGVATAVLGGGSNVVVADRGFDGLVVRVRTRGQEVLRSESDRVFVRLGAGELLDAWVARSVASRWGGVECLSGIPGYVGATPIQNVGAYGQEVSETIVEVNAIERDTGVARTFDEASCEFSYRSSAFKKGLRDRFVVTSVTFGLRTDGEPQVRYPELARSLSSRPTLAEVRDGVLAIRRAKSMVIEEGDPNAQSVGSFFVNPVVPAVVADAIAAEAVDVPRFAAPGGAVKLSAAWLIERSGFVKGTRAGRVGVSTRHALALVNLGGATAAELVSFAARIRDSVRTRFAVTLDPEPVFVGFVPADLA